MKPGLIALFLVALIALGLSVPVLRSQSVLEEAYSQTVVVLCGEGYGTGWWVNSEYIVTAYHVVDECSTPQALRGPWSSEAVIAAFDRELDVAVLKPVVVPEWARGLPLSYSVSLGDRVYVVGYPVQLYAQLEGDLGRMSIAPRVLEAVVAWLDPSGPYFSFQPSTDAGNSGGPIVSESSGGVVGIVVFARSGIVSQEFYALRMDALAQFLEQNNIDYKVARSIDYTLVLLGLGALALILAFIFRLGGGRA